MKRLFVGLGVAVLLSGAASGQAPQGNPSFDIADVHVRARGSNPNPQMSGGVLRGGRYDLRNATMVDLITTAYGVDSTAVLGGPNWLETDRFDVAAKAPQSTSPDNVKVMLQALLADRFKLVLHKDTKTQLGFALAIGSGKHKLKEPKDVNDPGGCQPVPQMPQPGAVVYNVAACRNITMEMFVQQLRGMAGNYVSTPITDLTGLKGSWDFDLKWTARAQLAQAGSDGISMADAVDKQLGLKLESRAMPTPVLIVDSVNQKPADNSSDIAQKLPALPPAEFEVASVKLSEPGTTQPMGRLSPGGRIDLQGFTLRMLATLAWDISDDELLAGAPKWMDETRYSVVARTSTAALGTPGANAAPLDIDDVRLMMQALLVERFKMKAHVENRPVTAYALVAGTPKLTKADPANRSSWKNGAALGARDPRDTNPILSRLVTCQNMSMAQLADALPRIAPGYIRTPVVDATGLEGNWDFSFTFTPSGVGGVGGGGGSDGRQAAAPPAPSSAADPTGAVSLFDALNKQLGLRLEVQKRPLPVLVIDHVEEKPTDD